MSIVIKLDGPALRSLIQGNEEFRLELQRCVITEITRQIYMKDVAGDIQKLISQVFKEHQDDLVKTVKEDEAVRKIMDERLASFIRSVRSGTFGYATQKKLSPELVQMINEKVGSLIETEVKEHIGTVSKLVDKAKEEILQEVLKRIGNVAGASRRWCWSRPRGPASASRPWCCAR
jgi:hypothetical protein